MTSASRKLQPISPFWNVLRAAVEKRRGETPPAAGTAKSTEGDKTETQKPGRKHTDAFRETIESVVIAFVLAFLFRTFLAEAFVIPTGSMAPTLMGRHKDFSCAQCGHHYTVGASDEVERDSNLLVNRLASSVCPNCGFSNDIFDDDVFNGDRILVNKFPYELREPDRFDVFVFRWPEDPQTNYIKRLVGLPGESLKIERGDLYARQGDQGEFCILRKRDPNKQRVLQQIVYDDARPPNLLIKHGFPERWIPARLNSDDPTAPEWLPTDSGWQHDTVKRSFQVEASDDWAWLRYRHLVPRKNDWDLAQKGETPNTTPRPELIADFCGYNAHRSQLEHFQDIDEMADLIWVGDLTLDVKLDVKKISGDSPAIRLELVEGVRRYRCELDLKSGGITLLRTNELKEDDSFVTMATSDAGIKRTGRHTVSFANVDDRLCVWIDGRLISFGADAEFSPPPIPYPQRADLYPVGIAARGVSVTASHLVLHRDMYYRASKGTSDREGEGFRYYSIGRELAHVLGDVDEYNRLYNERPRSVEFEPLNDDEYFAMGDNSSHSYDGRLWTKPFEAHHSFAVSRRALIGKAFFIYWPHGVPFMNDGHGFPVVMHRTPSRSQVDNYPLYTAPFYPQWWRWTRIR